MVGDRSNVIPAPLSYNSMNIIFLIVLSFRHLKMPARSNCCRHSITRKNVVKWSTLERFVLGVESDAGCRHVYLFA